MAKIQLAFKKLKIFQAEIIALSITYHVEGLVQILSNCVKKIIGFPSPILASDVKSFLGTVSITGRWVPNFAEIANPFSRLTEIIKWRWTQSEKFFLKILKVKCSISSAIYGLNLSIPCYFHIDASRFAVKLAIIQKFKVHPDDYHATDTPIIYNFLLFNKFQRCYPTYKQKLCGLVKFITKYDYLYKHLHLTTLIHTDHKSLIFFTSLKVHERVYGHWADQLQRLNVKIVYIPGPQNKAADRLSVTIFQREDCQATNNLFSEALANIKIHKSM